jgi:hypothetical protein
MMKTHVDQAVVGAVVAAAALFMSSIAVAQAPPAAQPVMPRHSRSYMPST